MEDFLIIGGGIAGLSAGAYLAAQGTVTLLEGEDALGYHASSRSAAMFIDTYGHPSVKALSEASARDLLDTGLTSPRGMMVVAREDERAAFKHASDDLGLAEIPVEEAFERIPILDRDAIVQAGYHAQAADIDTDALLQLYARRVRANGNVVTRARATAITRTDSGWEVEADGQTYRAKRLVNAAGPWADTVAELAGIAPIGFRPFRRSMARIEVPGGADATTWPMVMGASEDWYAKPDAGALIVSPEEEDPSEPMDAWADDMVLAEGLARFQERITPEITRMIANWAGLRTFSPDRQLVIGPEATDPDFLWMAGQGGYGFQTAPGAGRLLAARAFGTPAEVTADIVAACDPGRFR